MSNFKIKVEELQEIAKRHGLVCLGFSRVPVTDSGDQLRFKEWQDLGYSGDMDYMSRPSEWFLNPRHLLDSARTIVSFASRYEVKAVPTDIYGYGRVARYALGKDYHRHLKRALLAVVKEIAELKGASIEFRCFTDAVPLLERALARMSSGFIGKNSMLIRPGYSSFFLLGEIVWDLEMESHSKVLQSESSSCKSCTRCMDKCPTEAIVKDMVVDSRKCISYLTIEKRGALNVFERKAIGNWIFGCDICQEVCPFNHSSLKKGVSADIAALNCRLDEYGLLNLEKVLSIRIEDDFHKSFAGTPLMRAGRAQLLRNACCVAANSQVFELIEVLEDCVLSDESEIVAAHAIWAISELSKNKSVLLAQKIKVDSSRSMLKSEIENILEA